MASAVERRTEEHTRRSRSPAQDRERRGTPPRRRSSPERRKGSPAMVRSPSAKSSASHRDRERSPPREKVKERVRSPQSPAKASLSHKGRERSPPREKAKDQRVRSPKHTQEQSRSPSPARRHVSRSPSPRTKRLRRAQGEREVAQVTGSDRWKAGHREEQDTVRHREHDEGRDASRDRKVDREAVQVKGGDHRKFSHREERDSRGKHREHDEGRDRDASRDRKSDREDTRSTVKDKKSDHDDGKDHSRERRAGRDDKSSTSKETLSSRDDDRHGRPNRDDWKSASSREQRVDRSDRKGSTREKPTDHEESNGGSGRSSRRGRSVSPEEHRHRGRHESHPSPRVSRSAARTEDINSRGGEASRSGDPDALARMNATAEALEAKEKQKPSFELSGKLAEETNRFAGVNLLYSEPAEARKSEIRWRLYVFKDGEPLNEPLYVHRMTCYLFGRERKVADVPTDHPSCSKQHAVLQYRLVEKEQPDGMMAKKIRPYLMDLDSTNGTFINGNRIEPRRYYELFEKDTIKFGNSSREYVLLHENSAE